MMAPRQAARVYGEGEKTEHGGWVVRRPSRPLLTVDNPARMALVWNAPVALRGVGFHLPTTASMAVDRGWGRRTVIRRCAAGG